jgi:hypothetical protein
MLLVVPALHRLDLTQLNIISTVKELVQGLILVEEMQYYNNDW